MNHASYRLLEHFSAFHGYKIFTVYRIADFIALARAPGVNGNQLAEFSIRINQQIAYFGGKAPGVFRQILGNNNGPGPIAKKNAGRTVRPVQFSGHHFSRHQQNYRIGVSLGGIVCKLQCIHKTGAGRIAVKGHYSFNSQLVDKHAGSGGAKRIRGGCGYIHMGDFIKPAPRVLKCGKRSVIGQIGSDLILRRHAAALDSGAACNPFVRSVYQFFQISIVDNFLWGINTQSVNIWHSSCPLRQGF